MVLFTLKTFIQNSHFEILWDISVKIFFKGRKPLALSVTLDYIKLERVFLVFC